MNANLIDGTFDFRLTTPIRYAANGQMRDGTFVTFYEPGGTHSVPAMRLKNIFRSSFPKLAELGKKMGALSEQAQTSELKRLHDETEANVASDIGEMLMMIDGFDIEGFLSAFDKVITTNHKHVAAKINNEQPFTTALIDEISPDDHLNMAAAYVNFMEERSQARRSGTGSASGL